jgi:sec-independent protein translocase protein TatA
MWRNLQGWHLVILLIVLVVLFGANRLPGAARSLGRSMKIFKSEIKDLREDDREPRAPGDAEQDEDPQRPGGAALEGRVVDDERDARRSDAPARGEHRPRG